MQCPACRNELLPGATACGHCGAHYSASPMSAVRRMGAVAWLAFGAFLAWALPKPELGYIIIAVAIPIFLWPTDMRWRRR